MELSDLERERLSKVERLRARGVEPYPPRVERTHTTAEAIAAYEAAEPSQAATPGAGKVAGPEGGGAALCPALGQLVVESGRARVVRPARPNHFRTAALPRRP